MTFAGEAAPLVGSRLVSAKPHGTYAGASAQNAYRDRYVHPFVNSGIPAVQTPYGVFWPFHANTAYGSWTATPSQLIAAIHHAQSVAKQAHAKSLAIRTAALMATQEEPVTEQAVRRSAETFANLHSRPRPVTGAASKSVQNPKPAQPEQEQSSFPPVPKTEDARPVAKEADILEGGGAGGGGKGEASRALQSFSQLEIRPVLQEEKPFAELAARAENLAQNATISPTEAHQIQQAAVIKSLKTNPETARNALFELFYQVADRVERHPALREVLKDQPTSDRVGVVHRELAPVRDALNALRDLLLKEPKSDRPLTKLTAALAALGLEEAFTTKFVTGAPEAPVRPADIPAHELMDFLAAELFDLSGRERLFGIVEKRIQAATSRAPDNHYFKTRVLGRLRAGQPRDPEVPEQDSDTHPVEAAGASSGASDHGAGAGPQ